MQAATVQRHPDTRAGRRTKSTPWRCPRDSTCDSRTKHDSSPGYRAGCRSGKSRAAVAKLQRDRVQGKRPRLIPAIGTRRRLQALHALGWPDRVLGERLLLDHSTVARLRTGALRVSDKLMSTTAGAVAELYIELSETDPPDNASSRRSRTFAARAGELPPEAWDILNGEIDDPEAEPSWPGRRRDDPRWVDAAKRRVRVAELTRAGWGAGKIAAELGVTERTVLRLRAQLARDDDAAVAA